MHFWHLLSAKVEGNGSPVDAAASAELVRSRKAQLSRQQESVMKVNEDAERINLLGLTKRKQIEITAG